MGDITPLQASSPRGDDDDRMTGGIIDRGRENSVSSVGSLLFSLSGEDEGDVDDAPDASAGAADAAAVGGDGAGRGLRGGAVRGGDVTPSCFSRGGQWFVHKNRVSRGLFAPAEGDPIFALRESSMVYAFFDKVADGNMSLPENTRKLIVLLSNLQHLLIGTSKFVANAYLPNLERFRFVDDACGSRKTVNMIFEDGEKGLSDLEIHIRIVTILPCVPRAGHAAVRFFVVFVVTPHVFNLRRAVDLYTGEPGSNQPQVNIKNAERRKMWQEIIQATFSLNAKTLGVPEFKCVISGTSQEDSFTSMFNLGGAFLRMRQHAQNLWGLAAEQVYIVGWEPRDNVSGPGGLEECIAGYHEVHAQAGLWDEEWTENFNAYTALGAKDRKEFSCVVPAVSFDVVRALQEGVFPFCASVMFFLGTGHHCSDDFPVKEIPEIVADFMRKQLLPGDVSAQLLGVGDCLDPAGYISIANADKVVYARQEHEDTGMKAKKSLSTYTHLHSVVTQLDEGKRVEVDFSLTWNSVLYVVSECSDGVRYTCPDVLHRLA
eukprot:680516-Rhodomonas_salina.1